MPLRIPLPPPPPPPTRPYPRIRTPSPRRIESAVSRMEEEPSHRLVLRARELWRDCTGFVDQDLYSLLRFMCEKRFASHSVVLRNFNFLNMCEQCLEAELNEVYSHAWLLVFMMAVLLVFNRVIYQIVWISAACLCLMVFMACNLRWVLKKTAREAKSLWAAIQEYKQEQQRELEEEEAEEREKERKQLEEEAKAAGGSGEAAGAGTGKSVRWPSRKGERRADGAGEGAGRTCVAGTGGWGRQANVGRRGSARGRHARCGLQAGLHLQDLSPSDAAGFGL